jgi:hypothetical protein
LAEPFPIGNLGLTVDHEESEGEGVLRVGLEGSGEAVPTADVLEVLVRDRSEHGEGRVRDPAWVFVGEFEQGFEECEVRVLEQFRSSNGRGGGGVAELAEGVPEGLAEFFFGDPEEFRKRDSEGFSYCVHPIPCSLIATR